MNLDLLKPALVVILYVVALVVERRRPLRRATQPKLPRLARNLALGAIGSGVLRLAFYPSLFRLSALAGERGWGLLPNLEASTAVKTVLGFLLLDYTLYVWHRLNHAWPFLWRFHNVHHVDLDVDVTTAARFHLGELALSTVARAGEILLFGVDPFTMALYDAAAVAGSHFHHSNVRLPERLEKFLNRFVVTPRMHGIHHSVVRGETDSNFSTVFLFWDRLHRTLRLGVPAEEIVIGVPSYPDPAELTFGKLLLLPFHPPRAWRRPDGTVPDRP